MFGVSFMLSACSYWFCPSMCKGAGKAAGPEESAGAADSAGGI